MMDKYFWIFGLCILLSVGVVSAGWSNSSAGLRDWVDVTSDSSGQFLVAINLGNVVGGSYNSSIYTSNDYGQSWTRQVGADGNSWYHVAANVYGDGSHLVAVSNNVSVSSNFGSSWSMTSQAGSSAIASSGDGSKIFAGYYGGLGNPGGGGIWVSNDSGASWSQHASPRTWIGIASSSDGSHLAAQVYFVPAGSYGGNIWTSNNSGITWIDRGLIAGSGKTWSDIASDSSGQYLAASVSGGFIYTSTNYGVSWTQRSGLNGVPFTSWSSIASSADGSHLIASVTGDYIYISEDFGASWVQQNVSGVRDWRAVASNADGSRLIAVAFNDSVWVYSPDCVENWTQNMPSSCDGIMSQYTITYTDQNACGTVVDLPVDNGTIVPCCVEDWNHDSPSSCNGIINNFTILYSDDNSCNTSFTIPVDNGTFVSCCVESWILHLNPINCVNGSQVKYYLDFNHCSTVFTLPIDNGTSISCQGTTGLGGSLPSSDRVNLSNSITALAIISPPEQPATFNFKGMFESITVLLEKLFAGTLDAKAVITNFTSYTMELLVTIVALTLVILAGIQFRKPSRRRGR